MHGRDEVLGVRGGEDFARNGLTVKPAAFAILRCRLPIDRNCRLPLRSIPNPRPRCLGFRGRQSPAPRFARCSPRAPIRFARFRRRSRRKRGEYGAVPGDDYFLTVFDPFGHIRKMISQVSVGRGFHRVQPCITRAQREFELIIAHSH
jgi:hypothetical protein